MSQTAPMGQPAATPRASEGLIIRISAGVASGRTPLAAFDGALRAAGVADFNLVRLSSVIPPGSTVLPVAPDRQLTGGFGDRLYCVYASCSARDRGTAASAGVAWSRRSDGSGAGLFVEHSGHSEEEVRRQLSATLGDMSEGRGGGFVYQDEVLASARCDGPPVCALVIATYRAVAWVEP